MHTRILSIKYLYMNENYPSKLIISPNDNIKKHSVDKHQSSVSSFFFNIKIKFHNLKNIKLIADDTKKEIDKIHVNNEKEREYIGTITKPWQQHTVLFFVNNWLKKFENKKPMIFFLKLCIKSNTETHSRKIEVCLIPYHSGHCIIDIVM